MKKGDRVARDGERAALLRAGKALYAEVVAMMPDPGLRTPWESLDQPTRSRWIARARRVAEAYTGASDQ